eukprot:m.33258 g.33258  ORF g.33258 m.33258 type:complete len:250 (-) comp6438_c0_seq4:984-1733(-)
MYVSSSPRINQLKLASSSSYVFIHAYCDFFHRELRDSCPGNGTSQVSKSSDGFVVTNTSLSHCRPHVSRTVFAFVAWFFGFVMIQQNMRPPAPPKDSCVNAACGFIFFCSISLTVRFPVPEKALKINDCNCIIIKIVASKLKKYPWYKNMLSIHTPVCICIDHIFQVSPKQNHLTANQHLLDKEMFSLGATFPTHSIDAYFRPQIQTFAPLLSHHKDQHAYALWHSPRLHRYIFFRCHHLFQFACCQCM